MSTFNELIEKYKPAVEAEVFTDTQRNELACFAAGLEETLRYGYLNKLSKLEMLAVVCNGVGLAFQMGKQAGGIHLSYVEEATRLYTEREPEGMVYETAILTPSQVEVKNHINQLAGLSRRWL